MQGFRIKALTLQHVRPTDLHEDSLYLLPELRVLDLRYKQPPGDWDEWVLEDL